MKQLLFLLTLLCGLASAQVDIHVNQIGPYTTIASNVTWAGSGTAAINNNYIFTPVAPNIGVCLYLTNLDSSGHSITLNTYITGDQTVSAFQGNTGRWFNTGAVAQSLFINTGNSVRAYFNQFSGAASIALVFSGGGGSGSLTAAISQTTGGGCASAPFPVTANVNPLASVTLSTQRGFSLPACVVNPGAGAFIEFLSPPATQPQNIRFWKIRLSSTAAGQIDFDVATTRGVTCTVPTPVNSTLGSAVTSTSRPQTVCTGTQPTGLSVVTSENVGANAPVEIDLNGYNMPPTALGGMGITTPAAITGTVCGTMFWGEQ